MEIKTEKENRAVLRVFIPVGIFVLLSLAILLDYSKKLNKIFDDTFNEQMKDKAIFYTVRMQQEITKMGLTADPLADVVASDKSKEGECLEALAINGHADEVALIGMDGIGVDSERRVVSYDPELYKDGLLFGMSTYHYLGEGTIGITTPVMGGNNIEKLFLQEYDMKHLDDQSNDFNFGKDTWVIMIDEFGRIMYRFGGNNADYVSVDENFVDKVSGMKSSGLVKFRDDITREISGNLSLDFDGDKREVYYRSMGINKWYLLIGVPETFKEIRNAPKQKTVSDMMRWTMASVALFVGMVIAFTIMDGIRQKMKSEKLIQLAETDQLTGLYNKVSTESKIREFMEEHPDAQSLIFVLDIDNFKKINDTMGHAFGDEVLRTIGQRIRMEFRASDIIGRVGGDEFIIFLKGLKEEEILIREAAKVENFFKNFKAGNEYVKYSATASIGCAVFPRDAGDFEGLYKAADQALYKAKQRGKNQLAFYKDPEGFGQSV